MRDVELYQQLLDLVAPWTVGRVELSVGGGRVDIWAEHAPELRWPCPECGTLLSAYDHEKAISKWARYITLVCDLDAATIEYVAEARRMESLDGYFLTRSSSTLTTS